MSATGFSFPCPHLASTKDDAFERFIKTSKQEPSRIYNPWPLLAGLKTYRQARTHPLARGRYLPTTNLDFYGSNLDELLTYFHEFYHLESDYTPAKVLARLLLSKACDHVSNMLFLGYNWDSEMEKSWDELVQINDSLTAICSSITLSEELLATALSFEISVNRKDLDALAKKEEEITNNTELPHFEESYFQTFKKVWQWIREERASADPLPILTFLQIYLQGIKESRASRAIRLYNNAKSGFLVVDSAKRCRILAESINAMRSGKELFEWLSRTLKIQEVKAYLGARIILTYEKDDCEDNNCLWILMLGGAEHEVVNNLDQAIDYTWNYSPPHRAEVILYPQEFDRGCYITSAVIERSQSREEDEALGRILTIESLLEQLWSGNGFCCPNYDPLVGCCCDPDWKESLNRISRWAKEGKFDQGKFNRGNWKDLPQECRINPKRTKILGNHHDLSLMCNSHNLISRTVSERVDFQRNCWLGA
jgi:hypothetical protein